MLFSASIETACLVVVRCVVSMSVNGGRTCLKPHTRRPLRRRNGFAHDLCASHPRKLDGLTIPRSVATVDASARQVDNDVCSVDFPHPGDRLWRRPM
jgi:hypothetical protein